MRQRWRIVAAAAFLAIVGSTIWTPRWWPWRWHWALFWDHGFTEAVAAYATLAVGCFAAVSLWRERQGDKRRRAAADTRVSTCAYSLRARIRASLQSEMIDTQPYQWAYMLTQWASTPADVFRGIVEEAAEASTPVAAAVREAFVAFARGALTAVLTVEAAKGAHIPAEAVDRTAVLNAHSALARSAELLEAAIDPRLLALERTSPTLGEA